MSSTYLFHVQVSDFESHFADAEAPANDLESVADYYAYLEPLQSALEAAIETTLLYELHGGCGRILIGFVDQASPSEPTEELGKGVADEIAEVVETRLGWRPTVRVEAVWLDV